MPQCEQSRSQLTPPQHYNQLAKQSTADRTVAYNAWIVSHTPQEISAANAARTTLRRKFAIKTNRLVDQRAVPRSSAYIIFSTERLNSGEFQGIAVPERMRLIGKEWQALSAAEKKVASPLTRYDMHA